MIIAAVGFTLFYYACVFYFDSHEALFAADTAANHYINNFVSVRGNYLYFDFSAGALLYAFRDQLPCSGWLALLCAALGLLVGADVIHLGIAKPALMALPFAYITVYIGLMPIPKLPLYSRGDYSYGIYLYGYPIQQLLVLMFPGRFAIIPHFVCSIIVVTCVAIFSWHCIEKPTLRIRKKFSFTARKGDAVQSMPTGGA
jgi:peptidoglycan/LPS O-acetylase OafA/YrhL